MVPHLSTTINKVPYIILMPASSGRILHYAGSSAKPQSGRRTDSNPIEDMNNISTLRRIIQKRGASARNGRINVHDIYKRRPLVPISVEVQLKYALFPASS